MPWRIQNIAILPGYRLSVSFMDGLTGTVDISSLVASPAAGVFKQLRDPDLFAQARVEYGAVTWPGQIDLAPDVMYAEIKEHGEWQVE